jgi:CHAD domain-containing protein
LPPAIEQANEDVEHVHQLRVATRRARAALDIFHVCLPGKAHRKAKKHLRRIRRAAGEARDWDVFLLGLPPRAAAPQRAGLDFLMGYAFAQRRVAQARLEELGERERVAFDEVLAETVAAIHAPQGGTAQTLGEWADPWLTGLLKELEQAAGDDLKDYTHLHRVRIVGKRLRYALEVFAPCFAPAFREVVYPQVEQMQDILGNANDSHVAVGRLSELRDHLKAGRPADWKRFRLGIERQLRTHRERLPKERRRFVQWWRRWAGSGGESALLQLLPADQRGL